MSERLLIDGRKLAAIRRDLYLTQDELAQKLEMSPANVRRIEQSEMTGMQVKYFRALRSEFACLDKSKRQMSLKKTRTTESFPERFVGHRDGKSI